MASLVVVVLLFCGSLQEKALPTAASAFLSLALTIIFCRCSRATRLTSVERDPSPRGRKRWACGARSALEAAADKDKDEGEDEGEDEDIAFLCGDQARMRSPLGSKKTCERTLTGTHPLSVMAKTVLPLRLSPSLMSAMAIERRRLGE